MVVRLFGVDFFLERIFKLPHQGQHRRGRYTLHRGVWHNLLRVLHFCNVVYLRRLTPV